MRLKLDLKVVHGDTISINYYHPLASAIYKLLRFGSPEFAAHLHDKGFRSHGKTYKLFSFSLSFNKFQFFNGLVTLTDPRCSLFITSPLDDNFFKNFLKGSFEREQLEITSPYHRSVFSIENAKLLPKTDIHSEMKLRLLSPLVLSKRVFSLTGAEQQYYLRPEDTEDINRILTDNLKHKYEALLGNTLEGHSVELTWDEDFLKRHTRVTKKIRLDEYSENPIDVIGVLAPFTIKGSRELIKIGYEAGFGEKNSMGFGMAEVWR